MAPKVFSKLPNDVTGSCRPSFLPSFPPFFAPFSLLFHSFFPSATGARTHAPQLNFPTPFCLRRYTTFATEYSCKERSKFGLLKCLVCLNFFLNCLKLLRGYIWAFNMLSSLRQIGKKYFRMPEQIITTGSGYLLQWLGKTCLVSMSSHSPIAIKVARDAQCPSYLPEGSFWVF